MTLKKQNSQLSRRINNPKQYIEMINKEPYIKVPTSQDNCLWEGWNNIGSAIKEKILSLNKTKVIVAVECNLGTYSDINLNSLKENFFPNVTCRALDIYKDENEILQMVKKDLTNHNNARISTSSIEDYFELAKLEGLRSNIDFIEEGVILIHGIGSSKICEPDVLIYSDLSRWELLQRFRRGDVSNIGVSNYQDEYEQHLKWSFFIDWRICNKIKRRTIGECDFFLETNNWKKPKLATGDIVRKGYETVCTQPFFSAPFFDPELWESNEKVHKDNGNFSWGYNCNISENNILLKIGDELFETPAINAIYLNAQKILGDRVYKKYGLELPITFNFIDSLDEQSYNIHTYPGVDFFKDNFAIHHKQYDNYYVMDAGKNASIGIGIQDDISKEYFAEKAKNTVSLKDKKNLVGLLNTVKIEKHDHLYIPEQTLHTRGNNAMVLHISTAPTNFELNLFNEKGELCDEEKMNQILEITSNIRENYATYFNHVESESPDIKILGNEFNDEITVKRITIDKSTTFNTNNSIQVLNLVEGESCVIEGEFNPFVVHYAETFLIPANVSNYTIIPAVGQRLTLLSASVS